MNNKTLKNLKKNYSQRIIENKRHTTQHSIKLQYDKMLQFPYRGYLKNTPHFRISSVKLINPTNKYFHTDYKRR